MRPCPGAHLLVVGLAAISIVTLPACGAGAPGAAPGTDVASDTVRGVVRLVGSEPLVTLLVVPSTGDAIMPRGAEGQLLRTLTGVEVMVRGRLTGDYAFDAGPRGARVFDMRQFVVRAVDGVAALDGILSRGDDGWMLTAFDGRRHPIAQLPSALAELDGARVYLVGPLDRAPQAYGIIRR